VADLLRPGGVLYISEIHPMVFGMSDDGRTLARSIVDGDYEALDNPGGTYAVPDAELASTVTYERIYAISEVFTVVRRAGLDVELLREHSYTNAPWPWAVRGDDGFYRLPVDGPAYPLAYTLLARKPR
jgi:hypothetical protein